MSRPNIVFIVFDTLREDRVLYDSRNKKCREIKNILINYLNKIKNKEQLMKIITRKEKSSLKKLIRDFIINGMFTKEK